MERKVINQFDGPVAGKISLDEGSKVFEMSALESTFYSASVMSAFVATTGTQGGDSGHGGRAVLGFENVASTDWTVLVTDSDGVVHHISTPRAVTIVVGGDSEIHSLQKLLSNTSKDLKLLLERVGTRLGADE